MIGSQEEPRRQDTPSESAAAPSPAPPSAAPEILTITEPPEDETVVGNQLLVRGSASIALGDVRVGVLVAGRSIGSVEAKVDRPGAFSLIVPVAAPPFTSRAELVVQAGARVVIRRAFKLLALPGVSVLDIAADDEPATKIAVHGVAPRPIDALRLRLVDETGRAVASTVATTSPHDGWGGVLLAASTFRAELAVPDLPSGTFLTLELSWYDPWTDTAGTSRVPLVVPRRALYPGALDGPG
jgi:hypothetical protein